MATRLEQIVKRAKELKKTAPASTKWTDLIKKASKQVTPVRARASNKAKAVRNLGLSGVKKKRSTKAGFAIAGVGEIRYKLKGSNFAQQIENGKIFKDLINKAYKNQNTEKKYEENFIREIAFTANIVKYNGTNYAKDYMYKGTISKFGFLDNPYFIEALKYLDRPTIKKMSGTDTKKVTVKRATAKKSVKKEPVKKSYVKKTRAKESEAIREKVRKDGFTMPHGYAVKKAVRETSIGSLSIDQLKRNTEAIERFNSKIIPSLQLQYKYAPASLKAYHKKKLAEAKKYVATLKKQNTSLKRHIK